MVVPSFIPWRDQIMYDLFLFIFIYFLIKKYFHKFFNLFPMEFFKSQKALIIRLQKHGAYYCTKLAYPKWRLFLMMSYTFIRTDLEILLQPQPQPQPQIRTGPQTSTSLPWAARRITPAPRTSLTPGSESPINTERQGKFMTFITHSASSMCGTNA